MCSWLGGSPRIWVAARIFFSMSSAKCAQQDPQGHVCAVGTEYNLNHAKWAWQKVVCRSPTSWPVCTTPLTSRLSTWWLNWVQKHPTMPPSMLAPARQVRRPLHLCPKISTSVSHLICFYLLNPEALFSCVLCLFYLALLHGARQDMQSGFDGDFVSLPQQLLESMSSFPLHLLFLLVFSHFLPSQFSFCLSVFWDTLFFHPFLSLYTTFHFPCLSSYSSAL